MEKLYSRIHLFTLIGSIYKYILISIYKYIADILYQYTDPIVWLILLRVHIIFGYLNNRTMNANARFVFRRSFFLQYIFVGSQTPALQRVKGNAVSW